MGSMCHPYQQQRQSERRPYLKHVDYSIEASRLRKGRNSVRQGLAVDISDSGLGIKTDYPITPGSTLWLRDVLNDASAGVVRWCRRTNGNYRVGIELRTGQAVTAEKEQTENLLGELDEATSHFISRLEQLEEACTETGNEEMNVTVTSVMNKMLALCADFEGKVKNTDVINEARKKFHDRTNGILSRSHCINRTRTWPQGSQGDYKTLEIAYKNTPLSEGLGYYLDLYLLNSSLAEAVRNRIKKLADILAGELLDRTAPKLLNVACGSCRELMGIVPEIESSGARITCIDSDSDAISFAQNRLSYTGIIDQTDLFRYNAVRMFDHELNLMEFGMQDIIYSAGFFDYLPTEFLSRMLGSLYALLNPGGRLIAPFKDASRYSSQVYHWISDWDGFLQRTEPDFRSIFEEAGIPESSISEVRDRTGLIVFYLISK